MSSVSSINKLMSNTDEGIMFREWLENNSLITFTNWHDESEDNFHIAYDIFIIDSRGYRLLLGEFRHFAEDSGLENSNPMFVSDFGNLLLDVIRFTT